ncbi:putative sensor domain DACNV-containing protein [Olivibacter jilunii]|uniref:putative sensor domain DACNV-containing protein n=1 Tax=Olivibacter jilunii TaxID=985016 RepID=UPI003F171413
MISETTYLAAKMISATLEKYFAEQAEYQMGASEKRYLPKANIIEAVIDAAFWASLRREEGYSPKISIALMASDNVVQPLRFANPVRFTPHNLVKLSPAVIQPSIHLGVWHEEDNLFIWGTTHDISEWCLVLEVIEPGLLVVKHKRHEGYGKFVNIAVLKGDQIKMVDERNLTLNGYPDLLASLLGMPLPDAIDDSVNILVELAVAMRRHNRGGLLLVVPTHQDEWKESIVHPIGYSIDPVYCALGELILKQAEDESGGVWREDILRTIDVIGGFTAIDGATIITKNYELLAFGAKVARAARNAPVPKVLITEPVAGQEAEIVDPVKIGGTRHLAAAQFVHDQKEAMALVASQDGLFTVFVWSETLQMVHAHRIDTLLL